MKKITIFFIAFVASLSVSSSAHAAGGSNVALDKAYVKMNDMPSLQNGAKLFVNYCLSCHSASYARYNRVAEDLGIPEALLKENLMFTTEKSGDLMKTTMPAEDAKRWFNVTPPDLTLVSRVRKPDWVYTYLRGFYRDESQPTGWNNSLFTNVAMPHAMYELQGVQEVVGKVDLDAEEHAGDDDRIIVGDTEFKLVHPGKFTPKEFDRQMLDLTAFLVYLAEPAQLKRERIGIFTIGFLIILMMLAYLLKKEFWRDVH